jgi:serine phosphatase RsbU (regulator of sigma subunit)/pSer/pThr/pTyr-binding forkhead associated (FHA) protein
MSEARLEVTDGKGWRVVPIDKDVFDIGRQTQNHLHLDARDVSRDHARIVRDGDRFVLHDRDSTHGTYVNGERVTERALEHGDRIQLGTSGAAEILFLVDPLAARGAAPVSAADLRQVASLLEKLRALGSGRVLDEVLELVLDAAIDLTAADRGFIMLPDENGRLEFKLARARGRTTLGGHSFETSRKIPETVFATGEQMIVEDLFDEQVAPLHTGTVALGIRHALCVPLRLVHYVDRAQEAGARDVIGVLYLDSRDHGVAKSWSSLATIETLSTEAGLAIENARLYREALDKAKFEQELKLAGAFQRALLPVPSRVGGFFTAAAMSWPSRTIGGDFFDYIERRDGSFGLILGDVAGKGASAALLAAATLGMFTAESIRDATPSALLSLLNQHLLARTLESHLLTACFAILTPTGGLTYSNAGHNPPILLLSSGHRRLDKGGLVLGFFETATYEQETIALAPGDTLVAFSDGVTEAFNADEEEFGDDRLIAVVDRRRGDPPQTIVDAIAAEVRAFSGSVAQGDDVTVAVLRYDGPSR